MVSTSKTTNKGRRRRAAAERWQRHLNDLRRSREQADRDRRKRFRWLILMWLTILESIPTRTFFAVHFAEADPPQQKRQPKSPSKSRINDQFDERDDPRDEYDRRFLSDYSTRFGEENQEVYDGLTHEDIVAYNRIHRPWLFPKFVPVSGMPERYSKEPVHIWTLLFEMQYPHARRDAIAALKLIVDPKSHVWIDACAATDEGWRDLRRCRRRTPAMTIFEFTRAAARWRAEQIRETLDLNNTPEDVDDFQP